jgi:HSP20 family molecular chaperone IbpA
MTASLRGAGTDRSLEDGVTRLGPFNSPLLLGFDQLERTLDRLTRSAGEGYPPYNIEKTGENGLRIVLAVAGFTPDDLAIELAENQLTIKGKQTDDAARVYLHRGIAARQFQRSFMLADGMEVTGAQLDNGLLSIELVRPQIEPKVRTIRIDGNRAKRQARPIDVNDGDN